MKKFLAVFAMLGFSVFIFAEVKTTMFMAKNGKWGIIDENLKTVVPAQYEYSEFSEFTGKYGNVLQKNGEWALTDEKNQIVRTCSCNTLYPYRDGWCLVKFFDNTFGFMNEKGEWLKNNIYAANEFSNGFAAVRENSRSEWKLIDVKGKTYFEGGDYKSVENFNDGYAIVRKNSCCGILRESDFTLTCDCKFDHLYYAGEKVWVSSRLDDIYKNCFYDEYGKAVSDVNFTSHSGVHNGKVFITPVTQREFPVEYDFKTKKIRKFNFGDVGYELWTGDLIIVAGLVNGKRKVYFADSDGKNALPYYFDEFRDFDNGLYFMDLDGYQYCVNPSSRKVKKITD